MLLDESTATAAAAPEKIFTKVAKTSVTVNQEYYNPPVDLSLVTNFTSLDGAEDAALR